MKGIKRLAAIAAAFALTAVLAGCENAIEYKTFYNEEADDTSVSDSQQDDPSQDDESPDDSEIDSVIDGLLSDDNTPSASQVVEETDDEYFSKAAFIGEALCSGIGFYVNDIDEQYVYTENNAHIGDILETTWSVDGVNLPLADVLYAAERKYVYIWIGPNDLNNYSPQGFADKYKETINSLVYANPMAYIGVVSVAPVSSAYEQTLTGGKVEDYNTKLAEMIDNIGNNRVFFFNITATLGDDNGNLRDEYDSGDGLHMTGSAYKAVAQYLFDNQIHPYLSDLELTADDSSETSDEEGGEESVEDTEDGENEATDEEAADEQSDAETADDSSAAE